MKYKFLDNEFAHMEIKNNILYVNLKKKEINHRVAQKIVDLRLAFVEGQDLPILIEGLAVRDITKGAREVLSSKEANQHALALAVIVQNPVTRTIANFFLRFQHPPYPSKLFNDRESAEEWLRLYLPKS